MVHQIRPLMSDPKHINILEDTAVPYLSDKTSRKFLSMARNGLTISELNQLMESAPLTLSDWAHILCISERSLQRYQKSGHRFPVPESEKLLRIGQLFNKGRTVFGSDEKFFGWLKDRSAALGGESPLSLLDSIFGLDMVFDELMRIEHGVFA